MYLRPKKSLLKFTFLLLSLIVVVSCSSDDDAAVRVDNSVPVQADTPEPREPIVVNGVIKSADCVDGMAGIFPCKDYDLQYFLTAEELGYPGQSANDCWGWTDPTDNNEYALIGNEVGTSFVNITDPRNPVLVATLDSGVEASLWRDIKVYNNHAFIIADDPFQGLQPFNHGIQVVDLTKLKNITDRPKKLTPDALFAGVPSAHNLAINEEMGYLYTTGSDREDAYNGGVFFIDIRNPKNPVAAGGYGDDGYSHDGHVVTYSGPDTDYTGREIYIGSNESFMTIVDVTDKSAPKRIAKLSYQNVEYTHQAWFTEDQKYLLLGDEIDEQTRGNKTRTIVFDMTDLDNPKIHFEYFGTNNSADHNGYVKGNTFYLASYTAGLRAIDISEIDNKVMIETGFFDTLPSNNSASFNGTWSVYPYFPSNNIILSDGNQGLVIVKKK